MYFFEYSCQEEFVLAVWDQKLDITHLALPLGDGGDESHSSDSGLHVLL